MPLTITDQPLRADDLRRDIEEHSPGLEYRRSALIRDGADTLAHYRHEVAHATMAAQCRVALGICMDMGRCAPPGLIPVDEMIGILTNPALDRQRDALHWMCSWACCYDRADGGPVSTWYRRWSAITIRAMVIAGLVTIEGRGDEEAVLDITQLVAEAEAAGQADSTQADEVTRAVSAWASREAEEQARMDEQREREIEAALAWRCEAEAARAGIGGAVEPEDLS